MTWVSPETGLLLGAITVPLLLLLYFLRLRRQPLRVSSTMLWEGAVEDLHANSPFQRLRPSVLLILQLIALLFVVLSLMQPQVEGGSPKQGKHVILIDRSASMASQNEDGVTRFTRAKEQAIELVSQLHGGGLFSTSGGETMVITFSDSAEIRIPFTSSEQQLISVIESIEPTHGTSNIEDALKLARAYTTNVDPEKNGMDSSESAQLELFSDGAIEGLQTTALQRGETLRYHQIGMEESVNIGIRTISAKRVTEASDEVQIFIMLVNASDEAMKTDVEVSVNGTPIGVQEVEIPPRFEEQFGIASVVFVPFSIPSGGVILATLSTEDSLPIDNIASIVIAPPKDLTVLLAENGSPLIRTVLEGMPLAELKVVGPSRLRDMISSGESSQFDVVVTRDIVLEMLPLGRFLIFGAPPKLEAFSSFVEGEAQVMLVANESHPVMRFVRFEDIVVSQGYEIVTDGKVQTLLEGSGWPAVMVTRANGVQVVYVAFDPLESNWPYLRSFPFFVYNAVQFLGRSGDALSTALREVGQTLSVDVPVGVEEVTVTEPNGDATVVRVDANSNAVWGPIRLAGQHTLSWNGKVQRTIAVNSPANESAISSKSSVTIGATEVTTSGTSGNAFIQLWPWALGAVLFVLLVEWWVYQRKTGGTSRFLQAQSTWT
jgi:hypothetical protein